MPDWEVIEQHIQNIEEALLHLHKYQSIPLEDFEKDLGLVWIAEKGLQILVQNLLDIGAHILASEVKNDWGDYGEIIIKLGKHGSIPQEFSDKIKGMAGLRNILVHEYLRIDLKKLVDFLNNALDDFVQFIRFVRRYQASSSVK